MLFYTTPVQISFWSHIFLFIQQGARVRSVKGAELFQILGKEDLIYIYLIMQGVFGMGWHALEWGRLV